MSYEFIISAKSALNIQHRWQHHAPYCSLRSHQLPYCDVTVTLAFLLQFERGMFFAVVFVACKPTKQQNTQTVTLLLPLTLVLSCFGFVFATMTEHEFSFVFGFKHLQIFVAATKERAVKFFLFFRQAALLLLLIYIRIHKWDKRVCMYMLQR